MRDVAILFVFPNTWPPLTHRSSASGLSSGIFSLTCRASHWRVDPLQQTIIHRALIRLLGIAGNFTWLERCTSKYAGAAIMYFVSMKLKKKYNITDERGALYEAAETWIGALDGREFLGPSSSY